MHIWLCVCSHGKLALTKSDSVTLKYQTVRYNNNIMLTAVRQSVQNEREKFRVPRFRKKEELFQKRLITYNTGTHNTTTYGTFNFVTSLRWFIYFCNEYTFGIIAWFCNCVCVCVCVRACVCVCVCVCVFVYLCGNFQNIFHSLSL